MYYNICYLHGYNYKLSYIIKKVFYRNIMNIMNTYYLKSRNEVNHEQMKSINNEHVMIA